MKLTPQEQKLYTYIKAHPACTSHDITRDTFIQKPCARFVSMKKKGIDIVSVGQKKYPGARAFEMYSIGKPPTRWVSQVIELDGKYFEQRVEVSA